MVVEHATSVWHSKQNVFKSKVLLWKVLAFLVVEVPEVIGYRIQRVRELLAIKEPPDESFHIFQALGTVAVQGLSS